MSILGRNHIKAVFCDALAQIDNGNFKVTFWDGTVYEFGNGDDFSIHFKNKEVLRNVLLDLPLTREWMLEDTESKSVNFSYCNGHLKN